MTDADGGDRSFGSGAELGELAERAFGAVLFDLDGTLIDSTPSVRRSWARWAAEHGIAGERVRGRIGWPARRIVAALVPPADAAAALERIERMEIDDVHGIAVLPGALEALAALPADATGIVTSCSRPLAEARIAATGLPVPGLLVTADDVAVGKPDPAPYRLAAARLGLEPRDCLVVEDSAAGVASARAAGCPVLQLLTTHRTPEEGVDGSAATLGEVRFGRRGPGVAVTSAAGPL